MIDSIAEEVTSISPPSLPPKEEPNDGGGKRVIIGQLHRENEPVFCEGSLHFDPDFVYWDLNPLGFFLINAHTFEFENVLNLTEAECEVIKIWTRHGYEYLVGR